MTAVKEHEVSLVPPTDHTPAIRAFEASEFPTLNGREEEWRFTPLKRLKGLHDGSYGDVVPATVTADVATGVEFNAGVAKSDQRQGFTDRVAALAWEKTAGIYELVIPANVQTDKASVITVRGNGGTAFEQIDIKAGQFAEALVIVDHVGSGAFAGNLDISVGDGAHLTVVSLHDWDDDAVQLSHHRLVLGRDAVVKHVAVTLGGGVVRVLPSVNYTAPGGSADMIGLYFATEGQHAEHRLFVDHSVDHCRSNVVYKGALNGEGARTVWIGDVLIRANAVGTDTYEINRNLVLSDGGRADSVPNLEIETGEIVGAGHASTTGRFDDEQLFYLMSRGITEDEARRLVLRGFFDDLLNLIGVPEIDERIRESVAAKLEGHA